MPPRTPLETRLAQIWADVLGIEEIGVHDGFLELGGHSLRAAQVVARIAREIRADVNVQLLLERPTIAELAPAVAAHLARGLDSDDLEELLQE